ncbi:MAG: sulfatase [Candidatus Sumerlaeota bacterium]|nr:sulfatase [Candidatus Sumerlaeota bacterium]
MPSNPNVLVIMADQLRARSLPVYGETQIPTPHLDRLAGEGVVFDHMIANCPLCTPSRAMLVTGRYPQTTGHIINSTRTRHSEISIADAFAHAGYATGWIGKWHLHTGAFPAANQPDHVPEGRDRLGFQYWRAYNMHMKYFDGWVNRDDWEYEQWQGYETQALNRYAFQFLERVGDQPFLLFLSPHQPHGTPYEFAPAECYARVPKNLTLPANAKDITEPIPLSRPVRGGVDKPARGDAKAMYRHYLAMTIALDDMLGEMLGFLERAGLDKNTIVVFLADHGSQVGAQGVHPWEKRHPYEDSIQVPLIIRWPGVLPGGTRNDCLTGMPDLFPTLCALCGVPVPRTVEGTNLAGAWLAQPDAPRQEAVLTMNFSSRYDWFGGGMEWRGVRTRDAMFVRWLNGKEELFDLRADPLEMNNLAERDEGRALRARMEARLNDLMARRGDELVPCDHYRSWLDSQRRVVRNAFGPLSHPEEPPDWSLLRPV